MKRMEENGREYWFSGKKKFLTTENFEITGHLTWRTPTKFLKIQNIYFQNSPSIRYIGIGWVKTDPTWPELTFCKPEWPKVIFAIYLKITLVHIGTHLTNYSVATVGAVFSNNHVSQKIIEVCKNNFPLHD